MTKIHSRPEDEFDDRIKMDVTNGRTKYKAIEMTDQSVFALAQHYYTIQEIAQHFSVEADTILKHHGDAFRKGKLNALMKPRMLMQQFFDEVLARESLLGPEIIELNGKQVARDLDLHAVKGMMELHAKKYEGLGKEPPPTAPVNPLAALTELELRAQLELLGYVKKEQE